MLSTGKSSTCHLLLGLEQVCLCHRICELLAVAQPVAELNHPEVTKNRAELRGPAGQLAGMRCLRPTRSGRGNKCLGSALGPECT